MTLLRSRFNVSLHNYDFERKINGEETKIGIRQDSLITKAIVEKFDQEDKAWK